MLDIGTTLAAAGAGGGLLGVIWNVAQMYIERGEKAEMRKAEQLEKVAAIASNQVLDYAKQQNMPVKHEEEYHNEQSKGHFWFISWEKNKKVKENKPQYSPRQWVTAICLLMLCFTFCSVLFLWGANPSETIYSWRSAQEPDSFRIFGIVSVISHDKGVYFLTTGGGVIGFFHGIIFILTTVITGLAGKAMRS